ncbi:MAG: phenylacetate-CoA oxygenase/reductase subunit PaaK [Crocinitomicaceae bacterium]|nr:phenylacetate-CoA oxygenase/reductase subunit PaaK [Crocinitomicaceae bacterium]
MTPKFHSLKINDVRRETEDTVSISFDVPATLSSDYSFVSGQYLTLKTTIDGEDVRRSYSLCSAPHENEWRVAVKQVTEGKFSTYANHSLEAGMEMEVMTPTGNFVLNTDASNSKSYVLFAAGSGVTPVLSIAKSALNNEANSDVTLFYGNKGFASIIFREELEALKNQYMDRLRVVHVLSRESLGNDIQKGRIDAAKASELYDAFLNETNVDAVYVCGPEDMIHGVKDSMMAKGVDEAKIHFELFTAPSTDKENTVTAEESSAVAIASNVTIIIDGDQFDLNLDSTGQNILDAAQEAGADVPFACKGGVCCTCKAKIIEGTVKMDVNYSLEPDEVEAGFILTCQSHPTSDKLVVSFDE